MTIDYTPSNKVFMSLRGGYYHRDNYTEGVYKGDQCSTSARPSAPPVCRPSGSRRAAT